MATPVGRVANHLTASACPPEAQFFDHSTVIGSAFFLLRFIPGSAGDRTVTNSPA